MLDKVSAAGYNTHRWGSNRDKDARFARNMKGDRCIMHMSRTAFLLLPPSAPLMLVSLSLPFPLEIFLLIKECIADDDLRTHVCFYQTDRRIARIYDSDKDADKFWARLCWFCGISYLAAEDGSPDSSNDPGFWKKLSIKLINRDGFCSDPECGEALLEYNREWHPFEILAE